jgi:hypothetical protein
MKHEDPVYRPKNFNSLSQKIIKSYEQPFRVKEGTFWGQL